MKTNTENIWKLRDGIIDARIDLDEIVSADKRYKVARDYREQIDTLAELAEATELEVAEWWDVDYDVFGGMMALTRLPSHQHSAAV